MALPLSPAALQRLQRHAWPGNVRELRNLVERLCIHWKAQAQGQVSLAQLEAWAPELADAITPAAYDSTTADAASSRAQLTATLVRAALERAQGNRAAAAKALGVSRTTLWRWMQAQGLASSQ